jgi:hypothetical protein
MKRQQVQQMTFSASSDDFKGLAYSPALLLDAHLSAFITDHPHFPYACQFGFESYYEAIQKHRGKTLYSRSQVIDFVWDHLFDENGKGLIPYLSYSVGYILGGLSAIALNQYQDAQEGLKELTTLVARFENK